MIWTVPCGGYTLYAIEDGRVRVEPGEFFPNAEGFFPETTSDGSMEITVGCYLLTDGSRAMMVDTGLGPSSPSNAVGGRLPEALALIGISPAEIDIVVHTHLHHDHIGGNRIADGSALFPHATYFVHQAEIDHWLRKEDEDARWVQAMMAGFVDEGRVEPTRGRQQIAPGVSVTETVGHTPGHQSVEVASFGAFAQIVGDITHHPVQIAHPEWSVSADVDPDAAAAVRAATLDALSGSGTLMAACHYPAPGFGFVEGVGAARAYVPAPALQVG